MSCKLREHHNKSFNSQSEMIRINTEGKSLIFKFTHGTESSLKYYSLTNDRTAYYTGHS